MPPPGNLILLVGGRAFGSRVWYSATTGLKCARLAALARVQGDGVLRLSSATPHRLLGPRRNKGCVLSTGASLVPQNHARFFVFGAAGRLVDKTEARVFSTVVLSPV